MDDKLKAFLDDIVAVWHKHGLSFAIGAYDRLEVTEFHISDIRELYETIEDGRIDVLAVKTAEAERKRLEYERDHKEEIEAARAEEKRRREVEEGYARGFLALVAERRDKINEVLAKGKK